MSQTPNADALIRQRWFKELGLPKGYQIPASYEVTKAGVRKGDSRVTWAPLFPVRVYIDPEGNQLIELAWLDEFAWVRRTVARKDAASGRRLVAALGDSGLPVTEADAKGAERWIAEVMAANRGPIERLPLVRWLGWQPDGAFVASPAEGKRVEPRYDEQIRAALAHQPQGSMEDWQRAVKLLEPYPAAQMGLFGGLAAPLLEPLRLDSFTIDISGRSTRGKTTAVMTGLSAWADPSDKGDGMFHWRTTMIAMEKRLNLVRGIPVVIDETRIVKTPELVDQVLYQVPKNHGTPRGGGWPSLLPWQTIVLSTGEQPALSFTTHEGASARVLSVREAPFGTSGADSAAAAEEVRKGCCDNYGLAGPAFVARLRDELAKPGGKDRLRGRHEELAEQLQGDTDMTRRRAPMIACLLLAAELASEAGIIPFAPPELEVWQRTFAEIEDQRDNRPEEALDIVREFVAAHGREMWSPHSTSDIQPPGGWAGRIVPIDGEVGADRNPLATVALLPTRLREILRREGYVLDAVTPGWKEAGYLVENKNHRPAHLILKKLAGRQVRMFVFSPGVIPSTETEADDD